MVVLALLASWASPAIAGPDQARLVVSAGHTETVRCAAARSDRVATVDLDGLIISWDRQSRREIRRISTFSGGGSLQRATCGLDASGEHIVLAVSSGIQVWNLTTGALEASWFIGEQHPDGGDEGLLTGEASIHMVGDDIIAWQSSADSGKHAGLFQYSLNGDLKTWMAFSGSVSSVGSDGDGRVAVGRSDGHLAIINLNDGLLEASTELPPLRPLDRLSRATLRRSGAPPNDVVGIGFVDDSVVITREDGTIWSWGAQGQPKQIHAESGPIITATISHNRAVWSTPDHLVRYEQGRRTAIPDDDVAALAGTASEVIVLGDAGRVDLLTSEKPEAFSRSPLRAISDLSLHSLGLSTLIEGHAIQTWDLDTGSPSSSASADPTALPNVGLALASGEPRALERLPDGLIRHVDLASGETLGTVLGGVGFEPPLWTLMPGDNPTAILRGIEGAAVDLRTGDERGLGIGRAQNVAVSKDGHRIAASLSTGGVVVWDLRRSKPVRVFPKLRTYPLHFVDPEGERLIGVHDGMVVEIDVKTGKQTEHAVNAVNRGNLLHVSPSPGGRLIAMGDNEGLVEVLDLDAPVPKETTDDEWGLLGPETIQLLGHVGHTTSLTWADENTLLTTGEDGTTRVWSPRSGKERCRLYSFDDGTWAVVDREGRFDAPNGGQVPHLHWVVANEPVALEQLKSRYWHPGLLKACMGQTGSAVRDVSGLNGVALHPKVELQVDKGLLDVQLTERAGGTGRVVVRLNGKEVTADLTGLSNRSDGSLQLDLSDSPLVKPGSPNVIEVVAYNADGSLSSRGKTGTWIAPGKRQAPSLHALIIGTSDYQGNTLDLRFAAPDAIAFSNALKLGASELFESVHITTLATASGHTTPTRSAVIAALDALRTSTHPEDVVVVYLSGHGVIAGGELQVLLADAWTPDLSDPAVRQRVAISSSELGTKLAELPATKQVLVLDTCHSGKVVEQLAATRSVPGEQVRALDRMKDRAGLFVLAGSAADAVSYEASQYGQGLLTYSLLAGMRGAALRDDALWDVATLFGYSADRVPALALGLGGIQRPVVALPRGGASFDIGRATANVRNRIPLAKGQPVVLRANFQNEATFSDDAGLARVLEGRLRDRAAGAVAPFVYIDGHSWKGGYQLAGRYTVRGQEISLDLRIIQDGRPVLSKQLTGSTADLAGLADRGIDALESAIQAPTPRGN